MIIMVTHSDHYSIYHQHTAQSYETVTVYCIANPWFYLFLQDVEKILTESVAANKAKANNESQKSNDAVSTDTPAATKSSTTTSATATASSTDSAAGAAKSAASSA